MRGWGGYKPVGNWMTVGTGKMLEMVRITELEVGVETAIKMEWRDWEGILTPEFIKYVRDTQLIYYLCPECHSHI